MHGLVLNDSVSLLAESTRLLSHWHLHSAGTATKGAYHTEHMSCHTQDFHQALVERTTSSSTPGIHSHALLHLIAHWIVCNDHHSTPVRPLRPLHLPTQSRPGPQTPLNSPSTKQYSTRERGLQNLQATQYLQASPHPNFRWNSLHLHRDFMCYSHIPKHLRKAKQSTSSTSQPLHLSQPVPKWHGWLVGTWLTATCIIPPDARAKHHPPASLTTLYLKQ
jgi:hypothetical protein